MKHADTFIMSPSVGLVQCSKLVQDFARTPVFQRLHHIRQLSAAYYIYPFANHTRKEHSFEVASLARKWMTHLKESQPELRITDREVDLMELAGLWHDAGHIAHSHTFDRAVVPLLHIPQQLHAHEHRSVYLFQYAIRTYPWLYGILTDEEVEWVCAVVMGTPKSSYPEWHFQMINNAKCGIDVDRMAYIGLDSERAFGRSGMFIPERVFQQSRVCDGQLQFSIQIGQEVMKLFVQRFSLFRDVYTDDRVVGFEAMIVDIWRYLARFYGDTWNQAFQQDDPRVWLLLTDSWFESLPAHLEQQWETSDTKQRALLAECLWLYRRLELRLPYRVRLPTDLDKKNVFEMKIGYNGSDVRNPVDQVHWFCESDQELKKEIEEIKRETSMVSPYVIEKQRSIHCTWYIRTEELHVGDTVQFLTCGIPYVCTRNKNIEGVTEILRSSATHEWLRYNMAVSYIQDLVWTKQDQIKEGVERLVDESHLVQLFRVSNRSFDRFFWILVPSIFSQVNVL